jgi:hypothetical protein
MTDTTMNTGAASLSDEQKRAAITACALMIKGICLTTPNAEWTERIENRIHYLMRQIATTPQADAAIAAGGAQEPLRRIVCAANRKRFTGEIVLGIRHWDAFMHKLDTEGDPVDQGFIDNRGAFLSRIEAWAVAETAGQIIRRVGGDTAFGGTLYSENLY